MTTRVDTPSELSTKGGPIHDLRSDDSPEIGLHREFAVIEADGMVPTLVVTRNLNIAATDEHWTDVPEVEILRHTDSGWRPVVERRSQPPQTGCGRLLEMPPSYLEAA
ncbi:hypothetical protein PQX77_011613 [Marasmius sp. AFHP31]|nr:hypothetical protein PQX77_011613 [Marasmius sp. AFHP31]